MKFWKDGLIQEETISILYQKSQKGWSKKTIYTLRVLPDRKKQITRCRTRQVNVVVEAWRWNRTAKEAHTEKSKELCKTCGFPDITHAIKRTYDLLVQRMSLNLFMKEIYKRYQYFYLHTKISVHVYGTIERIHLLWSRFLLIQSLNKSFRCNFVSICQQSCKMFQGLL